MPLEICQQHARALSDDGRVSGDGLHICTYLTLSDCGAWGRKRMARLAQVRRRVKVAVLLQSAAKSRKFNIQSKFFGAFVLIRVNTNQAAMQAF